MGMFFMVMSTIFYLRDPSVDYIPFILGLLIVIIIGLCDLREYHDKNFYFVVVTVILVVMLVVGFVQPFSGMNKIVYYVIAGGITLIIMFMLRSILKALGKEEKLLEPYDKLLAVNPNDITALNNKGVKLFEFFRYNEAVQCFDKILELEPEDTMALQNKNAIEKMRDHTVADYLKKIPKFKIIEKNEKLILESKEKENL